ncbi:MAG: arsenite methyltransferase [Anaerolinea sp.]|nr:arsenite methyltransferase [Anaerolinea sp.]MCC6975050.1 arsenite methyltransferase [Anaerolineae bacterium]
MIMSDESIHDVVRNRYGAIARALDEDTLQKPSCCGGTSASTSTSSSASASCCGEGAECGTNSQLYDMSLLEGLPVDATRLSLGCGDPVSIANLKVGDTVLDLGSGGGIDCFLAARQVGETGHVIGVDMTPEMLKKARANKAKMGADNVEFRLGQIEALPVADQSVDVIMSNCVINLSPDKKSVFREAYRVLKQGGRVSISDIVTEGEFSPELRAQVDQWAACVTGAIDVQEYTGLMREVGFVDIQVVDKADASEIIPPQTGMPRVFSARITARKP